MSLNPFGRRHFLKGAGASLLLPLMPSLLPKAYAQSATSSTRFIQFMSSYGQYGQHYYPSDTGLTQMNGIFARPLSGITGDISRVLGPSFSPYKNKISLLRGMHVLAASNLHNGSMGSCASGTPEDNEGNGRPVFPYSMDSVISESAKIYPNAAGLQRHVNFCPASGSYVNFSWTKKNGSVQHLANTTSTAALLSKFSTITADAGAAARSNDVIQKVFTDYKSLRDGGKISGEDRTRLEAYMSLIDQAQKSQAAVARSCQAPAQSGETDNRLIHQNQANILAAALACGSTRVASYVLSVPYEPIHTYSHQYGQSTDHADYQRMLGEYLTYFMKKLDEIPDAGGGTLLDSSIIYWGNEYGENAGGDPHRPDNMTALVAGGGAGKLQMGYYIDYRKSGGVAFNNFLISIANAMGLSSGDYERDGVVGFGEYNAGSINQHGLQTMTGSNAERRKALPLFYKGAAMG